MSYVEYFPLIGIVLILVGVIFLIGYAITGKANIDFAFGGFIGPIPIGFATSSAALKILIVLMTIVAIVMLIVR